MNNSTEPNSMGNSCLSSVDFQRVKWQCRWEFSGFEGSSRWQEQTLDPHPNADRTIQIIGLDEIDGMAPKLLCFWDRLARMRSSESIKRVEIDEKGER